MGAGVGVAHDDGVTGTDEALFREDGVADAVVADIKEVLDVVTADPVAQGFTLNGGFSVFRRRNVVDNRFDL